MLVPNVKKGRKREVIPQNVPKADRNLSPIVPASVVRQHGVRILAVVALALIAYSNSFRAGFVFDNSAAILQDPRVHAVTEQNVHLIFSEELWYNSSTTGLYRPLTTLSFLVNYAVFGNGPNPAGYHWVNFALHAANIALVYLLGLFLLKEANLAWMLAALWGLHPVLTESVTNIVGRADLLAALGILAGLLCHLNASDSLGRRKLVWLAGLTAAAAIGIFSKESGAVLPAILLLHDLVWSPSAGWRQRWPSYAALALPFVIFFEFRRAMLAHQFVGLVPFVDNPLMGADFWTRILTATKVLGRYVGLYLWPRHLSADYSYNAVPLFGWRLDSWEDLQTLLALTVGAAAVVLAIVSYRRRKPLFFFIALFFVPLAPVANVALVIGTIMAERFLYLPSIGIAGCLIVVLQTITRRWPDARRAAWITLGLVCFLFSARTYARNFDWSDDLSLWGSAAPESFKAHSGVASSLMNANPPDLDRAVREADRVLAILDPLPDEHSTARPYQTAALGYRLKGDSVGSKGPAVYWYRKALDALLRGRRIDAAENQQIRNLNLAYGKSVVPTGWIPLYLELGRIYLRLGERAKALEALDYGRARRPDPEFSEEMSRAWRAAGDPNRAAVALVEGVIMNSAASALAAELVDLYRQTAPDSCALHTSGGTSVNLDCPLVHDQLCTGSRNVALLYRQNGQAAKAEATARNAMQSFGCSAQSLN